MLWCICIGEQGFFHSQVWLRHQCHAFCMSISVWTCISKEVWGICLYVPCLLTQKKKLMSHYPRNCIRKVKRISCLVASVETVTWAVDVKWQASFLFMQPTVSFLQFIEERASSLFFLSSLKTSAKLKNYLVISAEMVACLLVCMFSWLWIS